MLSRAHLPLLRKSLRGAMQHNSMHNSRCGARYRFCKKNHMMRRLQCGRDLPAVAAAEMSMHSAAGCWGGKQCVIGLGCGRGGEGLVYSDCQGQRVGSAL
jgi:hypothetical protein